MDWPPGPVLGFVLLTFAVSWILWVPPLVWLHSVGRLGGTDASEPLAGMPVWIGASWFAGASAPSGVAVLLAARSGGWDEVRSLLGRLLELDVGLGWNLVAWLGPPALGLGAIAAYALRNGGGVRFAAKRLPLMPVALVATLPFGPLGEELGWRGVLLPRLLATRGALVGALIVGVVWTLWHLPVLWAPLGTSISGSAVTPARAGRYLAEVTAVSVIMTWLFVHTAGSLWIAVGFHAAWNADMHRFAFDPFPDEVAERMSRWTAAAFTAAGLAAAVTLALD